MNKLRSVYVKVIDNGFMVESNYRDLEAKDSYDNPHDKEIYCKNANDAALQVEQILNQGDIK